MHRIELLGVVMHTQCIAPIYLDCIASYQAVSDRCWPRATTQAPVSSPHSRSSAMRPNSTTTESHLLGVCSEQQPEQNRVLVRPPRLLTMGLAEPRARRVAPAPRRGRGSARDGAPPRGSGREGGGGTAAGRRVASRDPCGFVGVPHRRTPGKEQGR